jgi:hypothetical protein
MEKLMLLKDPQPCKVCGKRAEHWAGPFFIPTKDNRNPFRHRHIPIRIKVEKAIRHQFPYADIPPGMRTVPLDFPSVRGGLSGLLFRLRERRRVRRLRAELAT